MIDWIIVGLLTGILFTLVNIGKELYQFRVHFDASSLNNYDRKNLIETIGRMHDALEEIRINTLR